MNPDVHLARDWTRLRCAALRHHPLFCGGFAAGTHALGFLAGGLLRARARGEVRTQRDQGRLIAALAWWPEDEPWCGLPLLNCALDYDPAHPKALPWIRSQIADLPARDDFFLDLLARYRPLLDDLLNRGFGVDSITLAGAPAPALAALTAAHAPPRDLATLDFQPLTEAFIDPVIALKHRIFAAHPEYCWFGADPRFLAREAAGMRAELATGRCFDEIILREGRLVGFAGLGIQHGNAFWGSTGGLDLVLDPEIQGQGVVKTAYRRVLERLVAEGVAVFKGGTSQPAVLALGRRMGRVMASVNVRHATPFSASHFGDWL